MLNLFLFILQHYRMHKVMTEENQVILTTDSRSPGLELDPGTPELKGPFTAAGSLSVAPNN